MGDRIQPYTIKEAMKLDEWETWKEAIIKEITGLLAMVLPGRMVLEIKTKDGIFEKCKARYVSRGDMSNRGEHYYESSSHQVRSKSLKMFYATAATEFGEMKQMSRIPRNLDIGRKEKWQEK